VLRLPLSSSAPSPASRLERVQAIRTPTAPEAPSAAPSSTPFGPAPAAMFGRATPASKAPAEPAAAVAAAAATAASAATSGGANANAAKAAGCCAGAAPAADLGMLPDSARKCRDCLPCVVFALFWVGMIIVGAIGIRLGKWQRLIYGTDYKGDVCGLDPQKGKSFITYPRTNEDFLLNLQKTDPMQYSFYGICVKSCPGALDLTCNYDVDTSSPAGAPADVRACLASPSLATSNAVTCASVRSKCWVQPQATRSLMFHCIPMYNVSNLATTTCSYPPGVTSANDPNCVLATETTLGSVQRPAKPNLLFDQLNSLQLVWGRWFGDLARAWWVILLVAVGLALLISMVYVQLLKYFTGCFVWTTIMAANLLVWFLTGYLYYQAGLVTFAVPQSLRERINAAGGGAYLNATLAEVASAQASVSAYVPDQFDTTLSNTYVSYKAMAYTATGVLVVLLCLTVAMRAAINTAVEVIKIGSEALQHNYALLLFPCTNIVSMGLFLVWWVFVAACIASAGTVSVASAESQIGASLSQLEQQFGANVTASLRASPSLNNTLTVIADQPVMRYLMIYHIFGLLWTTNFLSGISMMVVSGTICAWYFSKPAVGKDGVVHEEEGYKGSPAFIRGALWRTLRFYLGTVAIGSLLIAIVQSVRLAFIYLEQKLKKAAETNMALKFMLMCVNCLLACLEALIKVVTRNSYIFTQLKGDSFCASGGRVFGLIVKHGSVFAIVNVLGEMILFIGKLGISAICGWGAFVLLENVQDFKPGGANELSSTWMPVLATIFFAYCVSSAFMDVFNLTIDTILVCYVTDCDEHNGSASRMNAKSLDAKGRATLREQEAATASRKKAEAFKEGGGIGGLFGGKPSNTLVESIAAQSTGGAKAGAAPKV
jgi:choline transporter-like protein 2/4/5